MRPSPLAAIGTIGLAAMLIGARELAAQVGAIRVEVSNSVTAPKPMPTGTGQIAGQAVDGTTGKVIPGAIVVLTLPGSAPSRVLSDGDGRFAFPAVPKGRFTLSASLAGFSAGAFGRLRPSGPWESIDLADGERLTDAALRLWRFAAVEGTVVDERAEPIIGAKVQAFRRVIAGGRWSLAPGGSDLTDDRGIYRIGALEAGDYVVGVSMAIHTWPTSLEHFMQQGGEWPQELMRSTTPAARDLIGAGAQLAAGVPVVGQIAGRVAPSGSTDDGHVAAYETQFYSGAGRATDATAITLGSGEERLGVGFAMRASTTRNVSGVVTGPAGPIGDLGVRLEFAGDPAIASPFDVATSVTDGRGQFTFLGVPPGQYVIRAIKTPKGESGAEGERTIVLGGDALTPKPVLPQPPLPADPLLWGEAPVPVSTADVAGVEVNLQAGLKVRGRAVFSGARPAPAPDAISRIAITLEPASGAAADPMATGRGRIEPTLQFSTIGVPAGRYVLRVAAPEGWSVESAMAGGRDISIDAFDLSADIAGVTVTFTDRMSGVSGAVTGTNGGPDPSATVVVFPAEPAAWMDRGSSPRRLRTARVDRTGAFLLPDVPAGSYLIAAISETAAANWHDPATLAMLARTATRIDVAKGETRSVALQTTRINGR